MTAAGMATPSTTSVRANARLRAARRLAALRRAAGAPLGPAAHGDEEQPKPRTTKRSTKARRPCGRTISVSGRGGGPGPPRAHRRRPAAKLWTAGATPRKSASAPSGRPPAAAARATSAAASRRLGAARRRARAAGRRRPRRSRGARAAQLAHVDVDRPARRSAASRAALGEQQRLRAHDQPVALVDRRRHDQVDRAELVLEQQEDDPLGRPRPLARDDQPADRTGVSCRQRLEVARRDRPGGQLGAAARPGAGRASGRSSRSRRPSRPRPRAARAARARREVERQRELRALLDGGVPGAATPSRQSAVGARGAARGRRDAARRGRRRQRPRERPPRRGGQRVAGARPGEAVEDARPAPAREARSASERNGPPSSRAATSAATSSLRAPST